MKNLLKTLGSHSALLLVLFLVTLSSARAQSLLLTPNSFFVSGNPGQTVEFFATLTNTSLDDIAVNSIVITLELAAQPFITPDPLPFFTNVPPVLFSITSPFPSTTGSVSIFELLFDLSASPASYTGTVEIFGNVVGVGPDVSLASSTFQVDVTAAAAAPEPSAIVFVGLGLGILSLGAHKMRTARQTYS